MAALPPPVLAGSGDDHGRLGSNYLARLLIPNDVVLGVYLLAGLFGNLLVIYVYSFKLKTKRDNRFFIPFLAIFDLLACAIGASFAMSLNILPLIYYGDTLCKTLWFLSEATTIASSLLLLVIGLQRYLKVCRPFEAQMTSMWKKIALVMTVVSACLISSPTVLFYGEIQLYTLASVTGVRCGKRSDDEHLVQGLVIYNIMLFATAVVGTITMAVLYGIIARAIYHQFLRHRKSTYKKKRQHVKSKPSDKSNSSMSYDSEDKVTMRKEYSTAPPSKSSNSYPTTQETEIESQPSFPESDLEEQSVDDFDVIERKNTKEKLKDEKEKRIKRRSFDVLRENIESIREKLQRERVYNHFRVHRCTYMFMTITLIFVVSYTPRVVLMLLESFEPDFWGSLSNSQMQVCYFLYRMYLLNHVTNPFIYGLFDSRFRSKAKRLLCPCLITRKTRVIRH
ncbi:cholecystokinin receptor type A-like [Mizuhopecten yessoensis]|uniref:Muscarinic acetylcholine receptor M4 n=1 Tax=Mizuhopecten yessoensis TaxID=6573 RepID=A0A210QBN5_MIZYE|nr:cholecystokinin receptor type A-like [Mizuhopecten yessoensis]OWF46144.1 Muscarinic acetylcholine receptor M4 [Mizuhopecten yessoensis]